MPATGFAWIGLDGGRAAQFFVNCLAVAGGFLAGYVVVGMVAWFFDRKLTGGKSPPGLQRAVKVAGGLAAALLVALAVFGHGAGWTLLGGGSGDDNSKAEAKGAGPGGPGSTLATTMDVSPTPPPPVPPDLPPPEQRVRVTLLGGTDVRDERFYQLDDDPAPKALDEVKAAFAGKKSGTGKPVGLEVRFAPTNTLPRAHPAVLRLTNWAQMNGYPVTFPAQS